MSRPKPKTTISRRRMLQAVAMAPAVQSAIVSCAMAAEEAPLNGIAGIDRVTVLPGKTYLRGWAGYGAPPAPVRPGRGATPPPAPPPAGPTPTAMWSKASGPGEVAFADPKALITTATFKSPGPHVLKLTVNNGQTTASSTLNVLVETPPPAKQLDAVYTKNFKISSPLWSARTKALMVNWIPHCIEYINRTDLKQGPGGIDNFVEAGKALRGEPHGYHKGYVFSNAWVHQTVEAMSIALMIDSQGDTEIVRAHEKMRATLEDWIPKILAAQEPDGYLQTAFTLPRIDGRGTVTPGPFKHWERRGDHEGYVAGYFLESAINHYLMTGKKDTRLYDAAKKLADCWHNNLGPAPKKAWYDGHQEMEQALVRFGRFVNDMEGGGKGQKYVELAKFLLDNRNGGSEYDQSHLPVVQQYEAVGHAVRAVYTYSGMADAAVETHDPDYQSAVKSLWDNLVNKKYYVTGGVGSGETSEGFGPNYSLRNAAYCESCSSCGEIFFQWKLNLAYHDAKYVDLYEETMYNALLGSTDLDAKVFYYTNPLDANEARTPWHVCPCCVGNIARTLLMVPTWAYAKSTDGVYVNMFVGSTINLENVGGTDVEMVQATNYPWDGKVAITVNPKAAKRFSLRIRAPQLNVSTLYRGTPEAGGIGTVKVNGAAVKHAMDKGYAVITRDWKAGDKVEFVLPLKVQRIRASDKIAATKDKVALRYGPLLYNVEKVDQDIAKTLSADAALTTEWRGDLLGGVMVIKGQFADGSAMMAIPNYARTNRDPAAPPPPDGPPPGADTRPPRAPVTSIVWIREA